MRARTARGRWAGAPWRARGVARRRALPPPLRRVAVALLGVAALALLAPAAAQDLPTPATGTPALELPQQAGPAAPPAGGPGGGGDTLSATEVTSQVQLEGRVFEIGRKLRCPVCVSESVADSNAQIAQEMRQLIQRNLEEGLSEAQILAYFQSRYGDWILLDPPKRGLHLVVWLLPIAAAAAGVVVLALQIRRWRAAAEAPIEVAPADVERVRDALRSDLP